MNLQVTSYPQLLVGLVALLVFPLLLGVRHAALVHFLLYAALAGSLVTAGSLLTERRSYGLDLVELAVEWWIRTFAVLLVGGTLFIVALLFL